MENNDKYEKELEKRVEQLQERLAEVENNVTKKYDILKEKIIESFEDWNYKLFCETLLELIKEDDAEVKEFLNNIQAEREKAKEKANTSETTYTFNGNVLTFPAIPATTISNNITWTAPHPGTYKVTWSGIDFAEPKIIENSDDK